MILAVVVLLNLKFGNRGSGAGAGGVPSAMVPMITVSSSTAGVAGGTPSSATGAASVGSVGGGVPAAGGDWAASKP